MSEISNPSRFARGALVALLLLLAAGTACGETIRELPKGAVVIDVRTPGEFAAGAFPGAINIPYDQIEARAAELPTKDAPIVVYCRSGRRSGIAQGTLQRMGFKNVQNGGGLTDMMPLAEREATAP